MEKFDLDDMVKGWFVGDFEPNVICTKECEVGIKKYTAGTIENAHYHKKAVELTVVVTGKIRMNNDIFEAGDIVKVERNEIIEFEAINDSTTVVFKTGSYKGDKFLVNQNT